MWGVKRVVVVAGIIIVVVVMMVVTVCGLKKNKENLNINVFTLA